MSKEVPNTARFEYVWPESSTQEHDHALER